MIQTRSHCSRLLLNLPLQQELLSDNASSWDEDSFCSKSSYKIIKSLLPKNPPATQTQKWEFIRRCLPVPGGNEALSCFYCNTCTLIKGPRLALAIRNHVVLSLVAMVLSSNALDYNTSTFTRLNRHWTKQSLCSVIPTLTLHGQLVHPFRQFISMIFAWIFATFELIE